MEKNQFIILLSSVVVAVFLSIFVATMFVESQKPMPPRPMGPPSAQMYDDAMNLLDDEQRDFDRMHNKMNKMDRKLGNEVKMQEMDDKYKIIVNLKPFKGNANAVKVNVNGDTVNISGNYSSEHRGKINSYELSQSITLPFKFDKNKITQEKKGHFLVIEIPEMED